MVTLRLMCWIRPRLPRVAAGWLVFQLALLISVPTTLCCAMAGNAVAVECTCDHNDGQMCPMHHTRSALSRVVTLPSVHLPQHVGSIGGGRGSRQPTSHCAAHRRHRRSM